ncbi:MAG: DNA polymerase domain-containing protein [Herbinix sp.]|nr:DNA polymerase domain-containing protein [Herbinix sp.]
MKFLGNIDTSNKSLLSTIYHDRDDALDIVLKDNDSNKKYLYTVVKPKMEIYIVKPEFRDYQHNKIYIETDKCDKYLLQYKNMPFDIPKILGGEYLDLLDEFKRTRDFSLLKTFNKSPYLFGTDYDIENWYRVQWRLEYENMKQKRLTRAFLDIEVDGIDFEGVPTRGVCPINAVTLIDQETNVSYTLLLENDKNPLIEEFKNNLDDFDRELHESFDKVYGSDIEYRISFFEDERDLIKTLCKLINTINRDFLMIWNIAYDLPYIIERCRVLGMEPEEVISHPDFQIKEAWFREDNFNKTIASKSHKYKISTYTVWLDQMWMYAGLRKSQSEIASYSLNYVANLELGDNKVDYSDEADIKTLPYVNYRKFVKYNIKDVLLQKGLDVRTEDLDNLFSRSYINSTDYANIFKQTVFLKHRITEEFLRQDVVPGNNVNIYRNKNTDLLIPMNDDEDDDGETKFAGAFVADPLLNNPNGIKIMGTNSKFIYKFVVDYDFSSMYPNIIVSHNMSPHTMYGKVFIDRVIDTKYNQYDIEHKVYDAGKEFIDNYTSEDPIAFGAKWMNLPSTEELANKLKNKHMDKTTLNIFMGDIYNG